MLSAAEQSGIYEIVNRANGKRYVGSAACFRVRFNSHRMHLRRGSHHNRYLQASFAKHGEAAFDFKPLLVCSKPDLIMFEQRAIDALAPEYNIARTAGNTLGVRLSDECKAKISAKAMGRKYSAETVEKRASKIRGVPLPPHRVAHLIGNQHAKGLKHTAEWKAATSVRLTGMKRPKSPEYRAKISATLKGRTIPDEVKAKIAATMTGKKRGPYKLKAKA